MSAIRAIKGIAGNDNYFDEAARLIENPPAPPPPPEPEVDVGFFQDQIDHLQGRLDTTRDALRQLITERDGLKKQVDRTKGRRWKRYLGLFLFAFAFFLVGASIDPFWGPSPGLAVGNPCQSDVRIMGCAHMLYDAEIDDSLPPLGAKIASVSRGDPVGIITELPALDGRAWFQVLVTGGRIGYVSGFALKEDQ